MAATAYVNNRSLWQGKLVEKHHQVQDTMSGYIGNKSRYLFLRGKVPYMADVYLFGIFSKTPRKSRVWETFPHSQFHDDEQIIIESLIGDGIGSTFPVSLKVHLKGI